VGLIDPLVSIAEAVIPRADAPHSDQYRWRVSVGCVLLVTFIGLCGVTAFAFGFIPGSGFARASDLQSVVSEIRENRANTIDNQILELRIKHCQATTDEAKQLYWSKISVLMAEYQHLTGRAVVLPSCADL